MTQAQLYSPEKDFRPLSAGAQTAQRELFGHEGYAQLYAKPASSQDGSIRDLLFAVDQPFWVGENGVENHHGINARKAEKKVKSANFQKVQADVRKKKPYFWGNDQPRVFGSTPSTAYWAGSLRQNFYTNATPGPEKRPRSATSSRVSSRRSSFSSSTASRLMFGTPPRGPPPPGGSYSSAAGAPPPPGGGAVGGSHAHLMDGYLPVPDATDNHHHHHHHHAPPAYASSPARSGGSGDREASPYRGQYRQPPPPSYQQHQPQSHRMYRGDALDGELLGLESQRRQLRDEATKLGKGREALEMKQQAVATGRLVLQAETEALEVAKRELEADRREVELEGPRLEDELRRVREERLQVRAMLEAFGAERTKLADERGALEAEVRGLQAAISAARL